jgi:hypothetical protein
MPHPIAEKKLSVLDAATAKVTSHTYYVYCITLHSDIPLALPTDGPGHLATVELRTAPDFYFTDAQP